MAEYIEREALIKDVSELEVAGVFTESLKNEVLKIISEQATADVAEVRHGKWIKTYPDEPLDGHYYCSRYNKGIDIATGKETPTDHGLFYCANCGTIMDLGDDEE